MTQEKYDKANEIKDKIAVLKREFYNVKHIETCHKGYGMCRQYWDNILELLWCDTGYRENMDSTLFKVLSDYKKDIMAKIESLENEFNQL